MININDQKQMFVGLSGAFFISLSSYTPQPLAVLMNGPQFWRVATYDQTEYIYAKENPLTQEVFIVSPIGNTKDSGTSIVTDWGVLAIDLMYNTLSQIDYAFTAMASLLPTEGVEGRMFIMGIHVQDSARTIPPVSYVDTEVGDSSYDTVIKKGARIVRYGYGSTVNQGPFREFSRDGMDYPCYLTYGKSDFGDRFSEKKLRSYALHLSDIFQYETYMSSDYTEGEYTAVSYTHLRAHET